MSNLTQESREVVGFSVSMVRGILEGWKAEDCKEIGVETAAVVWNLGLQCLIPLSELDTGIDRHRRHSEERLECT